MVSNEPNSRLDVEAWCKRTGNQLVNMREEGGHYYFHIKKVR